jgi:two-component system response regulator HydG
MQLDDAAMRALVDYDWPGNVRELENVIERGVILQEGERLTPEALPERVLNGKARTAAPHAPSGSGTTLEELEKAYLIEVLETTGWHKKKASAILGINSSTLYRKIQRYGLEPQSSSSKNDE